jgi:hypothetical protein
MQYVIDYLGAAILGAALLLIINAANDAASENNSLYNGDMLVQEMLVNSAYLLEGELRNMGAGVGENKPAILLADTSEIRFLYDIGLDGTVDTVYYAMGLTSELPGTQNELDRPLYRRVNQEQPLSVGAVTVFNLKYLTKLGEVLATPVNASRLTEIHTVEITMEVQNPYAILRSPGMVRAGERNALYSSSLWQQTRLASQNMKR